MKKKLKKYTELFCLMLILVFFDQLSKYLIVSRLGKDKSCTIIDKIFSFEYLENRGVAFGFLYGHKFFILTIAIIVTVLLFGIILILERSMEKGRDINYQRDVNVKFFVLQIICSFLIAGSVGNMIDRIRLGYVIDFIKIDFFKFPTFNVADCYVTLASLALLVTVLFFLNDEDLALLKIV